VARKARQSRGQELVQGSGSRPKSAGGFAAVHHKIVGYLVEPQNQDRRLGGRRRDTDALRSFDAGGHVAGS
jgi:hypothetical protein